MSEQEIVDATEAGKVYLVTLQGFSSGRIVKEKLKRVDEDDCNWRTADDNSEIDHWNWQIIGYEELQPQPPSEG